MLGVDVCTQQRGQLGQPDNHTRVPAHRFPSRDFAITTAWLTAFTIAVDLLALTESIVLHDDAELAKAEPKTLRCRLLHVAARITGGQHRLRLCIDRTWRWAITLARAFQRVHTLPQPLA